MFLVNMNVSLKEESRLKVEETLYSSVVLVSDGFTPEKGNLVTPWSTLSLFWWV